MDTQLQQVIDTIPVNEVESSPRISAIVRLTKPVMSLGVGQRAIVVDTRKGRYTHQIMAAGFPFRVWVKPEDIEEVFGVNEKDWWSSDDVDA